MTPLLTEIAREKVIQADALWEGIALRRRLGIDTKGLPATLGEFNQQVRALSSVGLVTVSDEGLITYIPRPMVVVEPVAVVKQGALFV